MVVTRLRGGRKYLTIRDPETRATMAEYPSDCDWVGIDFKLGTFMPLLPATSLRDRKDVNLTEASSRSFYLDGTEWEYPSFENAETFIQRLVQQKLIVSDPYIDIALSDGQNSISQRTEQRRFLRATGMSRSTIRQIERVHQAIALLRLGIPILDVGHELGYFDQAHMTRSLKHFAGKTPAQIFHGDSQLSFLYNISNT